MKSLDYTGPIFIKPLSILLSVFGILPWYNFTMDKLTYPKMFKFYSILLVSTLVSLTSSLLFVRIWMDSSYRATLVDVVESVSDVSGLFFLVTTLLGSSFWNMNIWELLLPKVEARKNFMCSTWFFVLRNMIMFIVIVLDYMENQNGVCLYYTSFFIYRYVYLLTTQAVICFVASIRCRYKSINDLFDFKPRAVINGNIIRTFKKIEKLYFESNDLMDNFNTLFGWPLLLLHLFAVVQTQCVFALFIKRSRSWGNMPYEVSTTTLLFNIEYILELLISLTAVILYCDSAVVEAEKSLSNCYMLEHTLSLLPNELKELESLKKVIKDNSPKLTAAGFFEIRRSTLISVFGTITTYLIVVLQFNAL